MKQIVITYEGSKAGMDAKNVSVAETLIMLTEALTAVCDEFGMSYEQAIKVAYKMEKEGELWEGVER
ncbi:hypothetical protein NNG48_07330 [Enterococcus faecium]|nr:hypothetical protein [Enterococcus faecium]